MSTNTTISFNTDREVKDRLQKMADANGLTVSDIMRISALRALDSGIVIEPELEPSIYLKRAIKSSERDLRQGDTTSIAERNTLDKHLESLRKK